MIPACAEASATPEEGQAGKKMKNEK